MYYIPQVTKSGCGFACLKMLLAIAHKDERYLYIKEDEEHGPYSYQDIVSLAEAHNVTLIGVNYDDKDDLSHIKSFPLILTVKKENACSHAVLLVKRKGKKLKIYDPENGIYWIKTTNFIKKWDGTALCINKINEKPFTYRVIDVKDTKGEIISYFMQAIAATFIALATFFVKPEGSYFLPLLFCALSLLSEIILRTLLLKRMQKCDKYLRRFLPYVNRRDYFEYYRRSQEYKRSSLTKGLNLVFYFLMVILIITISLINSLTFVVSIGVAFLGALLEVFFFTPYKKSLNKELESQENELHFVKESDDMELKVKNIEVKSYRFAYMSFASKVVFGSLFIMASFFISAINKTFALTNIVFYTCVSYLIYQYLVSLFSYDSKISENNMAKARINNLIHQFDEKNSKRR